MTGPRLSVASVLEDPLLAARRADRALGYVGLDLPEELLAAGDTVSVHLPWQRGTATPFADRWLEDSFPGWARSILERWAAGDFDFLPAVVFSRGDDVSQRLYYYVCELQRLGYLTGPTPLVFDVARLPRATSAAHTARAVARLATELGFDTAALADGMHRADARRATLDVFDHDLRGACRERTARASLFAPIERLDVGPDSVVPATAARVLLAGSVPPDDGLHIAVAAAGWTVAAEVHALGLGRLGPPIGSAGDAPAAQIADHVVRHPRGARAWDDPAARIVAAAKARDVAAVILWLFEEDEAFAWDVVGVHRALAAAGLPTLVLARRRWDLADAPGRDIEAFLAESGR
jgi:hypothetical protein